MGLVDSNGNAVVKYSCTAYGEQISCTDTSGINLGEINKFRFKGYYEKHIGLFYLISRFYDPTIGRFISPDSIDYLDPRNINGLNLYAYCNNDPVNYFDRSGHSPLLVGLLLFIGISTIGFAAYGGTNAGMAGGNAGEILAGIGKGTVNGLISGFYIKGRLKMGKISKYIIFFVSVVILSVYCFFNLSDPERFYCIPISIIVVFLVEIGIYLYDKKHIRNKK